MRFYSSLLFEIPGPWKPNYHTHFTNEEAEIQGGSWFASYRARNKLQFSSFRSEGALSNII